MNFFFRPSGLHLKLGAGIAGAVILYYYKQYRTGYLADKDAMYRHYIQLHPEEFKAPGLYVEHKMHLCIVYS